MEQGISPRFWIIFVGGIAVVVGLGFLLAFLGRGAGEPAATTTTAPPAKSPAATLATSPISPLATKTSATSPIPTPTTRPLHNPTIPEVAPDFALGQAGGGTFRLSEQLVQGPVVLVFFQRVGG